MANRRNLSKPEGSALKFDRELYSAALSSSVFSEKEARQEYARLRRAANERLRVLEKHGLADSRSLQWFPKEFASAAGQSEREVRKRLADVAHFMSLQTTSLRGQQKQRKAMVEALQERGYDFINKNNVASFGKFMDAAKKHFGSKKSYDSEQIVDLFEQYEEAISGMSPEEMESYFDMWEAAEDIEEIPEPDAFDFG